MIKKWKVTASKTVYKNKKIVMVKQYRHTAGKSSLEIPSGAVERERPEKAALRELEEEAGYKAKKIKKLISFYPLIGRSNALCHIFFANNLEKSRTNPDEDEYFELLEIEPSKALEYISREKITHAGSIIGILTARKKRLI